MSEDADDYCSSCGLFLGDPTNTLAWWSDIVVDEDGHDTEQRKCGECNGAVTVLPTGLIIEPLTDLLDMANRREAMEYYRNKEEQREMEAYK